MTTVQSNILTEIETVYHHLVSRKYYSRYPENPKAYSQESIEEGERNFQKMLNQPFPGLIEEGAEGTVGSEVSPFLQVGLGISYPRFSVEKLVQNAQDASKEWKSTSVAQRAQVLMESLDAIAQRFSELAYATMHTSGQSFLMSFQASGPHALDRSLEAIAMGFHELNRFPNQIQWTKNLGKFDLVLDKNYKAIPKGTGVLVGCSTFPTWNTLPGLYANLICGNVVIAKPHPKAICPMAIVIAELQQVLHNHGLPKTIAQLAADDPAAPITKALCEHPQVRLIDYTGGNDFGNYVEQLEGKTVFTEKAGINSVLLHSSNNLQKTAQNIAFSLSLYSGQMCTAPQNIYVSKEGINTPEGNVSAKDFGVLLADAIKQLVLHPKAGPGTIAAIQNDATCNRVKEAAKQFDPVFLEPIEVKNPEFEHARILSPTLVYAQSNRPDLYLHEYFGPMAIIVETESIDESINIASQSAREKGAITCLAYCTNPEVCNRIEASMNESFTPVSFNFEGAAFVNQHAAFSDLHVTGGNPAGNASFTDPNFINQRFVWVGNRYMSA